MCYSEGANEYHAKWIDEKKKDATLLQQRSQVDGGSKNVALIFWKMPQDWAEMIAEWVEETGQKNTVLTVYELLEGEATKDQEFHGMDTEIMNLSLKHLVQRGRAQIFGDEDQRGVKFF